MSAVVAGQAAPEDDLTSARKAAASLLTPSGQGDSVGDALYSRIQRFLFKEARLLDEERYREWYDLLADDLFYWAPLRENRFRRDKRPELNLDASAFFDERKADIDLRLRRLESGMAWAEDPPTRHVYALSNIEAFETEHPDEFEVHCVFTLYRHRAEHDSSTLMGRRRDILRLHGDGFLIARRLILLQQAVLAAKNLSVFF